MTSITTKLDSSQPAAEMAVDLFDNWFDPIETEVRARAALAAAAKMGVKSGAILPPCIFDRSV
jgi:hypothetical protein